MTRWSAQKLLAAAGDKLLDPSVVFSFDKSGFRRHARRFVAEDLQQDLRGRVVAVTGANSGIGYATTHALASLGARVWMLCRSLERGQAAAARLRELTPEAALEVFPLDLADRGSVERLLDVLPSDAIDVLIHNAGILASDHALSSWGLERTLATNLVGPFALTDALLPRLAQGTRSRIIWVSSGGMYTQRLVVDALDAGPERFDGVVAYARTKRAMVVLSEQLAAHLDPLGIAVHAMHPGWADTPGVQSSIPGFHKLTKAILRRPAEGADTVVWLAACDKAQSMSGRFWFDRRSRSTYLLGKREHATERERLWDALHHWGGLEGVIGAASLEVSTG